MLEPTEGRLIKQTDVTGLNQIDVNRYHKRCNQTEVTNERLELDVLIGLNETNGLMGLMKQTDSLVNRQMSFNEPDR